MGLNSMETHVSGEDICTGDKTETAPGGLAVPAGALSSHFPYGVEQDSRNRNGRLGSADIFL